jgi:hypothetical protein
MNDSISRVARQLMQVFSQDSHHTFCQWIEVFGHDKVQRERTIPAGLARIVSQESERQQFESAISSLTKWQTDRYTCVGRCACLLELWASM